MNDHTQGDLNTVIATAVQARIETEVATALAGSELMTQYVATALGQTMVVRDPGQYRDRTTTFLREVIDKAIKAATEAAVRKVIADEAPQIEAEVTRVLRRDVKVIAAQLVGEVAKAAESPYGVTVELKYPSRD